MIFQKALNFISGEKMFVECILCTNFILNCAFYNVYYVTLYQQIKHPDLRQGAHESE